MKRFYLLFLMLLLLHAPNTGAQSLYRSLQQASYHLSLKEVENKTTERQIFNILAANNGTNIYSLHLDFSFAIQLHIERSGPQRIKINVSVSQTDIAGEDHFRDFDNRPQLLPSSLLVKITLVEDENVIGSYMVELFKTNGYEKSSEYLLEFTPSALSMVEASVTGLTYHEDALENIETRATLINYYYAYSYLMEKLITEMEKVDYGGHVSPSTVFLFYQEIHRLGQYIRDYQFEEELHLDQSDPLNFRKQFRKCLRLEKRAQTLFTQRLSAKENNTDTDKLSYCKGVAGLSEKYLELGRNQQPYIASSFTEMAGLNNNGEFQIISQVADYYDKESHDQSLRTPELLMVDMLNLADSLCVHSRYSEALLVMDHSQIIINGFNGLSENERYNTIYVKTLDGLLSSYLKVANMAFKSGNRDMAEVYNQKAQNVYEKNKTFIMETNLSQDSFVKLFDAQYILARQCADNRQYVEALLLLDRLHELGLHKQADTDIQKLDTSYALVYRALFNEALQTLNQSLVDQRLEDANQDLLKANALRADHAKYLEREEALQFKFDQLAYAVYIEQLQKGEILMDQNKREEALPHLLIARELETANIVPAVERLQSLLSKAVVPVILELINQANLETWANRLEQADKLYKEAISMQQKYALGSNPEINKRLLTLDEKMHLRLCVDLEYKYKDYLQQMQNRVNSGAFDKARMLLQDVRSLIETNASCLIDTSSLHYLSSLYFHLFEFLDLYEGLKEKLYAKAYTDLIPDYQLAIHYYNEHHIRRFGIQLPSFYEFVEAQQLLALTGATVTYYIGQKQSYLALEYLQLLKNQGAESKSTKDMQHQLGVLLSAADKGSVEDKKKNIESYTAGDSWYKYLHTSYVKNE